MNYDFINVSAELIAEDLETVRQKSPLVHNITNYVVMNLTANALLAVGASPIMADAAEEAEEITAHSDALVLNIGTLSARWIESMSISARTASRLGIPVVLDPVGAGFSSYRTNFVAGLLSEYTPSVIKGNPSEINAVAAVSYSPDISISTAKGVDTTSAGEDVIENAISLAMKVGCTVVVTGPVDYITDGARLAGIRNGSQMMSGTTGMGCTASALTGAFLSVGDDPFRAAVSAMAVMGITGELAARHSSGNGSFQTNFLDELCNINGTIIRDNIIWVE